MSATATSAAPAWTYEAWITEQAATVEAAMREHARRGGDPSTLAVYVVRAEHQQPGRLIATTQQPHRSYSVLRFGARGSRVMAVPYPDLWQALWNACRREPICPVAWP